MTRKLGFILFEGFQILDASGPIATFEIAARYCPGAYSLHVMAARSGQIASSSGARLIAGRLADPSGFDTVIVAGGEGTRAAALDQRLTRYVRQAASATRRIASV